MEIKYRFENFNKRKINSNILGKYLLSVYLHIDK